jgi:hypothetical protein
MTTRPEITQTLLDLAEGRLDPERWDAWWADHGGELLQELNPGQALRFRIASSPNKSPLQRIAQCQGQAVDLLRSWNVPMHPDSNYGELAKREFMDDIRHIQRENKAKNKVLRSGISRFEPRFPGFAAYLRRHARDLDDLGEPATQNELSNLESMIGGAIPPSLQDFLLCARSLRLGDLLQFDIDDMQTMSFSALPERQRPRVHGMTLLCEFWLQADGDQLAFDQRVRVNGECPIFYYAHEYRPPRLTLVAHTFESLVSWWSKGAGAWNRTLKG